MKLSLKAILASATIATTVFSFPLTAQAAYPRVLISDSFYSQEGASFAYVQKDIRVTNTQDDQRVKILEAYLESHNSPMVQNAKDFVQAADQYDLDWKLVAAIAGVESTFGKHTPGGGVTETYNAWGWGVYGNQALGFGSYKNGIYTVSRGLRENYFNKGLTNPLTINRKYAASPTWGVKVNFFMQKIEDFEKKYAEANPVKTEPIKFDAPSYGDSAKPFKMALGNSA